MRSSIRLLALVPSALLCLGFPPFSVAPAQCQTEPEYAAFYVVDVYDEARDPAVDLKTTVDRSQTEGKRILLEVGGVWCGWCKLLDGFIHDHPAVSAKLDAGFLIMKVNWIRGNPNEGALLGFLDEWMPSKGELR